MINCKICDVRDNPEIRKIYQTKNKEISVILNPKLSPHLGRLAVIPHLHFETTMTNPEYLGQLFSTVSLMEAVLDKAFQPDDTWLFYKGKASSHFHIDVIPIYNAEEITYDVSEDSDEGIIQNATFEPLLDRTNNILLKSYSNCPVIPETTKKGIEDKLIGILKDHYLSQ